MRKLFTLRTLGFVLFCLFLTKTFSQEGFEEKVKAIANKIESITKEEKEALKLGVEGINSELKNGTITEEQADDKKERLAELHAKAIETRVEKVEGESSRVRVRRPVLVCTHSFERQFLSPNGASCDSPGQSPGKMARGPPSPERATREDRTGAWDW